MEGFQCVDKLTDVAEDCDEGHLLDVGAFARHVWSAKKQNTRHASTTTAHPVNHRPKERRPERRKGESVCACVFES